MTQNNLGATLQEIGSRKSGAEMIQYLERSVQAYELALKISTQQAMPADWADTTTNLGHSMIELGTLSDEPAPIRRGISLIDEAMEIYSTSRPQEAVDRVLATRQRGVDWLDKRG